MNRYSQHGEEVFLTEYIEKHGLNIAKFIIDIGAYDGEFLSNSLGFIEDGWRAVLIEPHPDSFIKLSERHKDNLEVITMPVAITEKSGKFYLHEKSDPTLTEITDKEVGTEIVGITFSEIQEARLNRIGILSIDTEGTDTDVLRQALPYMPEIIIIESNELSERTKQIELLNPDYYLIQVFDVNTIWVRKDLF